MLRTVCLALLFTLALSSCTTLQGILDKIPDGKTTLRLETTTKVTEITVSKTTTALTP